jgi:hypothetical protein
MKNILFAEYTGKEGPGELAGICESLLEQQKRSWRGLSEAYEGLAGVEQRAIDCGGFTAVLQFNSRRAASSGAKVDPESIRNRRCFLCSENLPSAQRGILYRKEFLILCNPAPVLPRHFTASSLLHRPQSIGDSIRTLLVLAEDLGPQYCVFYNGPRCGASAPDHLHFQAVPAGCLPVEGELERAGQDPSAGFFRPGSHGGVSIFRGKGLGREVVLLEGRGAAVMETALAGVLSAMRDVMASDREEPMLNIACTCQKNTRVIIFPRARHRPDCFYREGEERKLVSPAALDMGGLIILPVKRDYDSIARDDILHIYGQVSTEQAAMDRVMERLACLQY